MHLQARLFQSVLARNSHRSRNENVGSKPKHRMQTCISILQSVLASDQGSMLSRVDGCRLMRLEALDYAPMRTEESRVKNSFRMYRDNENLRVDLTSPGVKAINSCSRNITLLCFH